MDGFFRSSAAAPLRLSRSDARPASSATVKPNQRTAGKPLAAHRTESSKTLMRRSVKKPQTEVNQLHSKSTPLTTHTQEPANRPALLQRSSSIKRFSFASSSTVKPTLTHLPVQPHPKISSTAEATPTHKATPQTDANQVFKRQLEQATSHQQNQPKQVSRTRKNLSLGLSIVAVLVLGGVIAEQNLPTLNAKLASSKAGFSASVPRYTPAGFTISDAIKSVPGQVTMNFDSNSDSRNYQIIQKPSSWTSASLLQEYVAPNYPDYQTVQSAGKTVYTYGNDATWVDGGTWYQLKANSALGSGQLQHIIDSL